MMQRRTIRLMALIVASSLLVGGNAAARESAPQAMDGPCETWCIIQLGGCLTFMPGPYCGTWYQGCAYGCEL